jgi:hypothetical protein
MDNQTNIKAWPYIISDVQVTVVYENKPYVIHSDDRYRYDAAVGAILAGDWEKVLRTFDIISAIKDFTEGDISIVDGEVFYKETEKLHGVVVDKLIELLEAGLSDAKPFIKFITNLLKNPSKGSVDELYDFLSYKSLPIDEEGYVLAYKGVQQNGWSITGNKQTVVLQGEVDKSGRILNEVGATIEVERRCVDDDRRNQCSHGLHVGSYDYASTFGHGKLFLVRFNPADAVSVPEDCSCQKLRVSKYEVISEVTNQSEIDEPYVSYAERTCECDCEDEDEDEFDFPIEE